MSHPKLLGDIGGTNVRLALQLAPDAPISHVETLPLAEHAGPLEAITAYLQRHGAWEGPLRPLTGCLGMACPVLGDAIQMINAPWAFSTEALRRALGLTSLRILNDFTALALALPALPADQLAQVGGDSPQPGMAKALLGAGTGLGVSGLIPGQTPDGEVVWVPIAGEGGHVSLPACTDDEVRVIDALRARFGHVSAERVLSGSGLVLLYETHARLAGVVPERLTPADVTDRAMGGHCPWCQAALDSFCCFMGTVAANLAVTLGAQGGLYIGGGVVPRLGASFAASGFRARFNDKGRYTAYLSAIPVYVIHAPYPALIGASCA